MSIASRMAEMAGGKKRGGIAEGFSPKAKGSVNATPGAPEGKPSEEEEKPLGHKLMQQAADAGGKHAHVMQEEHGGFTVHHAKDGAVEGPHDIENIEELKEHLNQFFNEEEAESAGESSETSEGLL